MKKTRMFSTGIVSILMIFVVVALGIFAILTYLSAWNDRYLTEKSREQVEGYYLAEGEKARVLYQLDVLLADYPMQQALEQLSFQVEDAGDVAVWRYPISETNTYVLKLNIEGQEWEIRSDYIETTLEWKEEEFDVWNGA